MSATPQAQQAAADYLWLSFNPPPGASPAYIAVFQNLGINAGYVADQATQQTETTRPSIQQKARKTSKPVSRRPSALTADLVLAELRKHPGGITKIDLAKALKVTNQQLGSVGRGMLSRGLVTERAGKWTASNRVTDIERGTQRQPRAPANTANSGDQQQATGTGG